MDLTPEQKKLTTARDGIHVIGDWLRGNWGELKPGMPQVAEFTGSLYRIRDELTALIEQGQDADSNVRDAYVSDLLDDITDNLDDLHHRVGDIPDEYSDDAAKISDAVSKAQSALSKITQARYRVARESERAKLVELSGQISQSTELDRDSIEFLRSVIDYRKAQLDHFLNDLRAMAHNT